MSVDMDMVRIPVTEVQVRALPWLEQRRYLTARMGQAQALAEKRTEQEVAQEVGYALIRALQAHAYRSLLVFLEEDWQEAPLAGPCGRVYRLRAQLFDVTVRR